MTKAGHLCSENKEKHMQSLNKAVAATDVVFSDTPIKNKWISTVTL